MTDATKFVSVDAGLLRRVLHAARTAPKPMLRHDGRIVVDSVEAADALGLPAPTTPRAHPASGQRGDASTRDLGAPVDTVGLASSSPTAGAHGRITAAACGLAGPTE